MGALGALKCDVVAAGAAAALALAACGEGGSPGDLFVVERSGTVPGAKLTLRIADDGGAYCNGGDRVELTSEQLLEARELRRALDGDKREEEVPGLAERGLRLPPARGGLPSVFRFRVRSEEGTIAFADNSKAPSDALPRLVKLTRDVAREQCGLAR